MEVYFWNIATVLSKVMTYLGLAGLAGYLFFSKKVGDCKAGDASGTLQLDFERQTLLVAFLGIIASISWFLASVGAMAEMGLSGAIDPDFLGMMWWSPIGDAAVLRTIGFALAVVSIFVHARSEFLLCVISQALLFLGILLIAFSFTLVGHISNFGAFEQALLALHIMIMAWWFGALYPLKIACDWSEPKVLFGVMERFGNQAVFMVSLLLAAGLWLAYSLIGTLDALLFSTYGQAILIKLGLVTLILTMAARHKLVMVPSLKAGLGQNQLARSIASEMVIAIFILVLTALITSVLGPDY